MSILVSLQLNNFETSSYWQPQVTSEPVRWIQDGFKGKSHLVINGDKLSNHMKQVCPGEHLWPHCLCYYRVQCRLHFATLSCFFPLIPNRTRDCPMVFRYVCFFTFPLVEFIMLADMHTTGQIATCVKGLPFALLPDKHHIISGKFLWVLGPSWMTDDSPAWLTPPPLF